MTTVAEIAQVLDAELAERLPEIKRLADAYQTLTGEMPPTLAQFTGGSVAEVVQLPAVPADDLPPAPADEVETEAPAAPRQRSGGRERIEQLILEAGADGIGRKALMEQAGLTATPIQKHVNTLLSACKVVRRGQARAAVYVHADHAGTTQLEAHDYATVHGPVVTPPVSPRVRRELEREDPVERLFADDEARQRIARAALKSCETDLRHPAAVASENVLNRNEVAYVMRELHRAGLLHEHDGKYGRAA